jgi:hypothetical protein
MEESYEGEGRRHFRTGGRKHLFRLWSPVVIYLSWLRMQFDIHCIASAKTASEPVLAGPFFPPRLGDGGFYCKMSLPQSQSQLIHAYLGLFKD